jgi:hypothetical protein
MVRITIEHMDDPTDHMLMQREVPWVVHYDTRADEFEVVESYAKLGAGNWLNVPCADAELAKHFADERAEAAHA